MDVYQQIIDSDKTANSVQLMMAYCDLREYECLWFRPVNKIPNSGLISVLENSLQELEQFFCNWISNDKTIEGLLGLFN